MTPSRERDIPAKHTDAWSTPGVTGQFCFAGDE